MRFLVLGAGGMAGHIISIYLNERGHFVDGLTRRPVTFLPRNIICDLTDSKNIAVIINEGRYDFIINCSGLLNRNADDHKKDAIYINSYIPHLVAEYIEGTDTRLIHLSTDCVFSGLHGDYSENSIPDGQTWYDRTKALGEVIDNKNLTFRNSIIGPDVNENGIGLFNWFMKTQAELSGYEKVIWTGVTTLTLAKAIEKACEQNLKGLYHLVNNEKVNKYELLKLFNKYFREGKLEITAAANPVIDKSLINTRTDFDFVVPSYETMITEMKEWIEYHKGLYSHYFIAG